MSSYISTLCICALGPLILNSYTTSAGARAVPCAGIPSQSLCTRILVNKRAVICVFCHFLTPSSSRASEGRLLPELANPFPPTSGTLNVAEKCSITALLLLHTELLLLRRERERSIVCFQFVLSHSSLSRLQQVAEMLGKAYPNCYFVGCSAVCCGLICPHLQPEKLNIQKG